MYAGELKWAALFIGFGVIAVAIAGLLTIMFPPGVYGEPLEVGRSLVPILVVSYGITTITAVHAARLVQRPEKLRIKGVIGWSAIILSGLVLPAVAGAIRAFAPFATYNIPSVSMEPTLSVGDVVLSRGGRNNCGASSIKPGDVVIYRRAGVFNIARAVAGPGQVIAVRENATILNGVVIDATETHSILQKDNFIDPNEAQAVISERLGGARPYQVLNPASGYEFSEISPTQIPSNNWFLIKDNRGNGLDSRAFGPVASRYICGVITKVLYSTHKERVGTRP